MLIAFFSLSIYARAIEYSPWIGRRKYHPLDLGASKVDLFAKTQNFQLIR